MRNFDADIAADILAGGEISGSDRGETVSPAGNQFRPVRLASRRKRVLRGGGG